MSDEKIAALEKRIEQLEKLVAELQKRVGPKQEAFSALSPQDQPPLVPRQR